MDTSAASRTRKYVVSSSPEFSRESRCMATRLSRTGASPWAMLPSVVSGAVSEVMASPRRRGEQGCIRGSATSARPTSPGADERRAVLRTAAADPRRCRPSEHLESATRSATPSAGTTTTHSAARTHPAPVLSAGNARSGRPGRPARLPPADPTWPPGTAGSAAGHWPSSAGRVDDPPGPAHLVGADEQRVVADQRVEDDPLVGVRGVPPEVLVREVHRRLPHAERVSRDLGAEAEAEAFVRLHPDDEGIGLQGGGRTREQGQLRGPVELHRDLGHPRGQTLAGTHVHRHSRPPPVVDVQSERDEGLGGTERVDARLLPVSGHEVLARAPAGDLPPAAVAAI